MKRVFLRGAEGSFENYMAALRGSGLEPVRSRDLSLADTCDGLLLPGGADVNPSLYGQENTASVGIDVRSADFWRASLEIIKEEIDRFCTLAEKK